MHSLPLSKWKMRGILITILSGQAFMKCLSRLMSHSSMWCQNSAKQKENRKKGGTSRGLTLRSTLSCDLASIHVEFLSYKRIRLSSLSASELLAPSYTNYNNNPKNTDCREQFKYDFLIAINMYALNRSTRLSSL